MSVKFATGTPGGAFNVGEVCGFHLLPMRRELCNLLSRVSDTTKISQPLVVGLTKGVAAIFERVDTEAALNPESIWSNRLVVFLLVCLGYSYQ